jgi:hypothetical protein
MAVTASEPTDGTEPERLSYVQFAALRGLTTDYDVQAHIHAGLMAAHMPKSYHRRYQKRLAELQDQRADGMDRYRRAIEAGEILPPATLSVRERLEMKAQGHDDLPSVQAARRLLARLCK